MKIEKLSKISDSERVILHCDCNGFYASVEGLDRPELKGIPMAVAGDPETRTGIILAKNELAKSYGIKTAETVYSAKRKCPVLTLVPPRHGRYQEISRKVNALYLEYTDQVEPFGIDESWLDVTGSLALLEKTGSELADEIRARVSQEIGITISVGVSFCKIFAKLGSDMKKPDATTVITRENFRDLVWPLPAGDLLFVGKSTIDLLSRHGINTIGDIAHTDQTTLASMLGKSGEVLYRYANGMEDAPVGVYAHREAVKSIGNGLTFPRDLTTEAEMRAGVTMLADEVATRLRAHRLMCRTIQVHIKNPALKTISRQAALKHATRLQIDLVEQAMTLIHANWRPGAPVRALTITAANLLSDEDDQTQISMFDDEDAQRREKRERLEETVYRIRNRFGHDSIALGAPDAFISKSRRTTKEESECGEEQ